MTRRHQFAQPGQCRHEVDEATCRHCALEVLDDLLQRIRLAVRAGRSSAVRDVAVSGGSPSWEPINLSAMTLDQEVQRTAWPWPTAKVLAWRDRARVILGDAFAPFPVLGEPDDDGRRQLVRCPLPHCTGTLQVQRDDQPLSATYARPTSVGCSRDREHRWEYSNGGFLRLRVLLDG